MTIRAPLRPPLPTWFRIAVGALVAVTFLGFFSTEAKDSDFWWHLKTGQYIWERHALPVPDPFSFTTGLKTPAYAGEPVTRYFNLTHEWLSQVIVYLSYLAGGFPGVVLFRALILTAFCGLVALIAYRRCGGFYRSLGAACATAAVTVEFASDRPLIFTFLFLAAVMALLEYRRWLWAVPLLMVLWANSHGGFVLGWFVLGAYSAEALIGRHRYRMVPLIAGISFLASGLNPNGFQIVRVLLYYRSSYLTSTLQEWAHPQILPPRLFLILIVIAGIVLVWQRWKVRPVDWILFVAFSAAALDAERNLALAGIIAPVLIVAYFPLPIFGVLSLPRAAELGLAALVPAALIAGLATGRVFQLRANTWRYPEGAAAFLLDHHVTAPIFNSYEFGGYLMWRLWPQQKVFVDGRALNESVFKDYLLILYNHDENDRAGGKGAEQLLKEYGVGAIVMNTFENVSGVLYKMAPGLADPQDTTWQLVYSDAQAVVFMRQPPPGVAPLDKLLVFEHLEEECNLDITHQPEFNRCARTLGQTFLQIGDAARARRWLGYYLNLPHDPDPQASRIYQQLLSRGR